MITATIDPGVNDVAVAMWNGTALTGAMLVRSGKENWMWLVDQVINAVLGEVFTVDALVIETPKVLHPRFQKGNQKDIVRLAQMVGAIVYAFKRQWPACEMVIQEPWEWKKQTPKPISNQRTRDELTEDETSRVELPAKSLQHNVFDAIGIGLRHLKRTHL